MLDLAKILRIRRPLTISITGAGGKTSTMYRIAASLRENVLATTTTHISVDQARAYPVHVQLTDAKQLTEILVACETQPVCATGDSSDGHRMNSIQDELFRQLKDQAYANGTVILVEADGSKMLPIKAPGINEPQIPEWSEQVIVCCGMQAIGHPIDDAHVHRAERFAQLAGMQPGEAITTEAIVRVLGDPKGGLKGIPGGSRVSLILNQADDERSKGNALRIAKLLTGKGFEQILISSLGTNLSEPCVHARFEKVAGIVLAAGGAERFGRPKQLLPVHGESMIRHIVEEGLSAGLNPMIVVTGAFDKEIRAELDGLTVEIVNNSDWRSGQSSSLRCGLNAVPADCGGAVFLLADQPFISHSLIIAILERAQTKMLPVIAPMAGGKRANPVYFDRMTFGDLQKVQGDTGGRAIFSKYTPDYLEWQDERILLDIDQVSDYEKYLRLVNEE